MSILLWVGMSFGVLWLLSEVGIKENVFVMERVVGSLAIILQKWHQLM
jgi:hypothetical protein